MTVEPGILLVPLLVALSGAIALIGNAVGRNIGRRRLSLFRLRPRHTAQIVTVITGMLITIVTLVVVLLLSTEARVALFRLNEVLQETHRLEAAIRTQEDRLKELAQGDIAYLNNQEVLRDAIDGRQSPETVRQRVLADLERAGEFAQGNGISPNSRGEVIVLSPPGATWESIAHLIDLRHTDTVLRLVANQNTLKGEPLVVFVQVFDNRLVYARGTVLVEEIVDGRQPRGTISRELLRLADQSARSAGGVLPPPFTLVTAPPTAQVDIDDHRAAVTRVQQTGRPIRVRVVAGRDIYTVGPLAVSFTVAER
jgi:uncharacterized protein (DUF3084 family)